MNNTVKPLGLIAADSDNYLLIPVLLAILAGAFLAEARTLFITILTFGLFALPGFIVFRSFTPSSARAAVYGVPLGYSLTSLLIITVVALRGWDISTIAVSYLLGVGALAGLMFFRRARSPVSTPTFNDAAMPRLPLIVALGIGIMVLALYIPFDNAGGFTEKGYAFTGLFGHDFILRAVDSVALANSIPPDNYFFDGVKTANYYILWYTLPATIYNLLNKRAEVTSIVAIVSLLNVPIFAALVYYALATFVATVAKAPIAAVRLGGIFLLLFLFCYSYHWLFFLVTLFVDVTSSPVLEHLATQMGPVSTSWFKDFLFQPHSVLALMEFLVVMHLALLPAFRFRGICLGILLGSLLLTDTVIFLIASSAFGLWYISQKNARSYVPELCVVTATVAAIIALAFSLSIFGIPRYSNKIVVTPYLTAIAVLPALLLLCLGALPVLAALALKQRTWVGAEQRRLLLILLIVSLFFMLFITEVLEGNVFLRKSLMTLRLPLFILSAAYLYTSSLTRIRRIYLPLLALAAPTLLTDLYATSNNYDERYTMYVTTDEMAAAAWLRTHTKENAVVQSLVEYTGHFDYSLTICFGERKAAIGLWKMAYQRYPNKEEITRRVREIQTMFSTTNAEERANLVHALRIDYIYIGPHERARFPDVDARFATDPVHFRQAYASASVRVYRVRT